MKRLVGLVLGLLLGVALIAPMGASAQAAPYCGITWGSLAKSAGTFSGNASVTDVRTGQHSCYDRMVVDVRGDVRGYSVRYVSQVHAEGSGAVVPLRGGARLAVVVKAPAYDTNTGRPTHRPADPTRRPELPAHR